MLGAGADGARVEGEIIYRGRELCTSPEVDPVEVRRRIGMVFQKPNPFPQEHLRQCRLWTAPAGREERSASWTRSSSAACAAPRSWDEVSGDLNKSGLALSGGQQQRLCIARTIAVEPDVILDGRALFGAGSNRDPAHRRADEGSCSSDYTIVIVTHNMQQAQRASDFTAFLQYPQEGRKRGTKCAGASWSSTTTPQPRSSRSPAQQETADYIAGRFG